MTEVICIGGTLTTGVAYPLYRPLLESFPSSIPARDRYIPIPGKGLGPVHHTTTKAAARIADLNLSAMPIIVGHSQGGIIAAELGALGLASAVVTLGAPHRGMKSLSVLEDVSPAAHDLDRSSDFIRYHFYNLEFWPSRIPLHIVNATYDQIVGRQFGLPTATTWWDAPTWMPRCPFKVPEGVRSLHSRVPSDHLTLPFTGGVRWLVSQLVADAAQYRYAS